MAGLVVGFIGLHGIARVGRAILVTTVFAAATVTTSLEVVFSVLAIVAAVGAVALVGGRLFGRSPMAGGTGRLWAAWLVAATSTAGSLYFSEGAHFTPCRLCWYQRCAMYPLASILLVAAIRRDHSVAWYAVPVAAAGSLVSIYHLLIEWNVIVDDGSCDAAQPCSIVWFRRFGFVSLALMALFGFAAIIALLTTSTSARAHELETT